jgi:hypothetical protein
LNVLSDIEVCEQDVINIISTLNADKAVGHDIINNRMLLAVKNEITKPLSMLFNVEYHGTNPDWNLYKSVFICR